MPSERRRLRDLELVAVLSLMDSGRIDPDAKSGLRKLIEDYYGGRDEDPPDMTQVRSCTGTNALVTTGQWKPRCYPGRL